MTDDEDIVRIHAVLRTAITGWLAGLSIAGGVHWQRALTPPANESYPRPFVTVQLRRPGAVRSYIGGPHLWRGEATIWAVADDLAASETLARSIAGAVPASAGPLTDPGGGAAWDATTRAQPAPASVPSRQQGATAVTYRVELERRSA